MNQTSVIGRPLHALSKSVTTFIEKRSQWYGPVNSSSSEMGHFFAAPPTSTGVHVNEDTAYTSSAFWACVNSISTDIGSFPLNLYKTDPDGGKSLLRDHHLFPLLHDAPNSEMTAFTFRGVLTSNALTWGMGFAEVVRDGAGRVTSLWPITPNRVTMRRSSSKPYSLFYEVTRDNGANDMLLPEQMFVLPGSTYDGVYGRNIVSLARESIGLGLAAEAFGGTFFGNGSTFGGVFEHPSTMTPLAQKNFRDSVNASHQGAAKAHKFIIAEEGMKYQKLGVDPNAAQFIETRQHQIEEMCRWFRMPPHKIGHLVRTSYNSVEQMNVEYATDTLFPWCVRWEKELLRQLVAKSEKRIQFFKHNMDSKLRADTAARHEAYVKGIQNGYMSADDVREKEDMNPLPNGAGKKYFIQSNNQPLDRVDEIVDAQIEPKPAPVAAAPEKKDGSERTIAALTQALAGVETRIGETAAKIATVEMDNLALRESKAGLETDASGLRQQLADQMAEAATLKALHVEATERADRLALERDATAMQRDTATAQLTATADILEDRTQALVTVKADADRLQAERDALATECIAATARVEQMTADHAAAVEALHNTVESEQQARALDIAAKQAAIKVAEESRDAQIAELSMSEASLRVATQHMLTLEGNVEVLRAEVAALTEARELATGEATAATTAHEALKQASAQAETEHAARLAVEQAARAVAEAELKAFKASEATRKEEQALANQKIILKVAGGLVFKEIERAKRHAGTPARLKAWADGFYLLWEETCVDTLRPFMQAHLVFIRSTEDVDAYTRAVMRPQLTAAIAQIRAIADGDQDDFPVAIERLLTRWEQDRAAGLADFILREEVSYVRSI